MRHRFRFLPVAPLLASLLVAGSAAAQGAPPDPPPGEGEAEPAADEGPPPPAAPVDEPAAPAGEGQPAPAAAAAPAAAEDQDGARFRGGVALAFGGFFGTYSVEFLGIEASQDYTGFLGGVQGHIGVQIMDLIGIYVVPHLSFGSVGWEAGGIEWSEGWVDLTATAVIDFTFIDRIFVGVGGGTAVHSPTCTNCDGLAGGALHFRAGGYPLMDFGEDGIRRMGLMIGADIWVSFLSPIGDAIGDMTAVQPMLTIGYEAY